MSELNMLPHAMRERQRDMMKDIIRIQNVMNPENRKVVDFEGEKESSGEYEYKHVIFDHPKNEIGVFEDLVAKYEKYGTLYIGVDFDNTLLPYGKSEDEIESGFTDIVMLLRWCKYLGMKLCLWTLPDSNDNLCWKIDWCNERGIHMDFINESPLLREQSKKYGKPHFNLLLDDVAGLESSFSVLYNLCEYIETKREKKGEEKE